MKHIGKRFLALLTSGAAAAGMISAVPLPAGAEDFVHGVPRKVLGGLKLVEGIENHGEYYYYQVYNDASGNPTYSYTVLEDHADPRSCSACAEFRVALPASWTVEEAADQLGKLVQDRYRHKEYEIKTKPLNSDANSTHESYYFAVYDPNRDDDFYGTIADLNGCLPKLGFTVSSICYYREYGIVNNFEPGNHGSYENLDEETVSAVNSYLQSIDSSLVFHGSDNYYDVYRKSEEDYYMVSEYYLELAEKFGIWPGGARTCAFWTLNPVSWADLAAQAQVISAEQVADAKAAYQTPDYCSSFTLNLSDNSLRALADKIGVALADGQALSSSLVAEALDIGFAAMIQPKTKAISAGYAYTVELNSQYAGQKDGAARLLAYLKQNNAPAFTAAVSQAAARSSYEQLGSYKRIDGLHEAYAAQGKTLSADTQFYFDESAGKIIEIAYAGNSGMELRITTDNSYDYKAAKAHISALAAQYFGSGCKTAERQYAVGRNMNGDVPAFIGYEITVPQQNAAVQQNAEKLYRTLVKEGYAVTECNYYPEFGYVNDVIPEWYHYDAAKETAISAYLRENAPDCTLVTDDLNGKKIMRIQRSGGSTASVDGIYVKVYQALGYWPDALAVSDGMARDFGTDLTKTVTITQAEIDATQCQWDSAYGKTSTGNNFYSGLKRFVTESDSNTELYTHGTTLTSFMTSPNELVFFVRRGNNITSRELEAIVKKYSYDYYLYPEGSSYLNPEGSDIYLLHANLGLKEEHVDAILKDLCDAGLIDAFYGPGDVASVNTSSLFTESLYYYNSGRAADLQAFDNARAWLAENYPDFTVEMTYRTEDRLMRSEAFRTDTEYFKVTPTAGTTPEQLFAISGELARIIGHWPEMSHYLTNEPVYAFRNNRLAPASEAEKGEPCEWLSPSMRTGSMEKNWTDYTAFDAKGMFGENAEAYIATFDGSSTLAVFSPVRNAAGCHGGIVNCTFETLVGHIQRVVSPYIVDTTYTDDFMLILPQNRTDALTQTDARKLQDDLSKDGLIRTFFNPGDVAAVSYYGPAISDALYYLKDNMQNADQVLAAMQKWLAENREGYQAEITQSTELGRTDTPYIKVTPKTKISNAELFALAADLYEVTGATPAFSQQLPNIPEYAVRNNSYSVRGDLNQDGQADVADAVMLARYLAEDTELKITDNGLKNADVQGNGSVSTEDLTMLLRVIAKQIQL